MGEYLLYKIFSSQRGISRTGLNREPQPATPHANSLIETKEIINYYSLNQLRFSNFQKKKKLTNHKNHQL